MDKHEEAERQARKKERRMDYIDRAKALEAEIERLKATLREVKEMTPSHYAREHAIIDAVLGERSKES